MATVLQFWSYFQSFVTAVIKRFLDNRCIENAAALTYTTLFAVVPLMTVTYYLIFHQ